MALIDEIRALRERALTDLDVAYDYYIDAQIAWRLVCAVADSGYKFTFRNTTTGAVTTQADLSAKARGYVAEQLAEATFQQFIAIFESFFFDLLRCWLMAFPGSLSKRQVEFSEILAAPEMTAVTELVVNKELSERAYERPERWFEYLNAKVKLNAPTSDEIERIAEAKATRDLLVHNRGLVNKNYLSKAASHARRQPGDKIDVPEQYHQDTFQLIRKLVVDISEGAIGKAT